MVKANVLLSGALAVVDYRCDSGPADRPFVECHRAHSLSYVRRGSFGYRTRGKDFELVAGSILVGHTGDEYVCTHQHHQCGDECLSFQPTLPLVDSIGGGPEVWRVACVPPLPELMVLGELAQSAAAGDSTVGLDEAALWFTHRFVECISGRAATPMRARAADRRRAVETALWLDENSGEAVDLETMAERAGWSPFHFLRVFSKVLGVTPHQYLVRTRLRRAARLLADETLRVTDVALDAGFADLSNFVRTFRRAAGMSPREFRLASRGERKILQVRMASAAAR